MQPEQDRKALLRKALTALDEMQAKLDASNRERTEPIAVVGMSCRFPGGANTPEAYWSLLLEGRDAVTEVPADRWGADDFAALNGGDAPTCYGGFLDQVDRFDPHFFGISPREALALDPQQRLVLEVVWEALERGGIAPDALRNTLTGVFVGITTNDYSQLTRAASELDVYMATGGALNAAAGRVAYTLGLQGPCMAIDSACSSSLVAVHTACQSLRLRESDLALAGGVNVLLTPEPFVCFTNWGMMAPDGRCKTFDAAADGFVRAEGCGVVVLKRLSDAIADGDRVLAVIRGSAVNQDGRSSGFTVPSGLAQQAVVRQAVERAGVAPADVGYVEAHGTGTSLGDPIEVEALGAVLADGRTSDRPLVLGSAKTNIGHCESASGIAGFIKAVLAIEHGVIPPHLHLSERSPRIPWPDFTVDIPAAPTAWPAAYPRRIAGVSSFGFSGTNAHVVLEQTPDRDEAAVEEDDVPRLLALSAKTESALQDLTQAYIEYLDRPSRAPLADVCYTASVGRSHLKHRVAIVASSAEDASAKLASYAEGRTAAGMALGEVPQQASGVAFLFTGQGSQYVGMGRALYAAQPVFRDALDRCDQILMPLLGCSIIEVMHEAEGESDLIHQTAYTQPALFAIEYALATLWQSFGVELTVLMGHSIGEITAACVAGVFSLDDALRLVVARGRLMQALPTEGPQKGAMAAVMMPADSVECIIASHDGVSIAAYNGPEHIVISGTRAAVEAASAELKGEGADVRPLTVSHAFHSALMDPMLDTFRREAEAINYHPPAVPLVSNVSGQMAGVEVARPDYWVEHVRSAVRFEQGMRAVWETGARIFIEVGPHPVLVGMGQQAVDQGGEGCWVPSLRRGRPDEEQVLEAVGALYAAGGDINWKRFASAGADCRRALLPTYPFQRKRFWVESGLRDPVYPTGKLPPGVHPLLGEPIRSPAFDGVLFRAQLGPAAAPYLADHRIYGTVLFPGSAFIEIGLAAARHVMAGAPAHIEDLSIKRALVLPDEGIRPVQVLVGTEVSGARTFEVFTSEDDETWVRHATGRIVRDTSSQAPAPALVERGRFARQHDVAEYYGTLEDVGAHYGPSFHGLRELYSREGEALGRIQLPQEAGGARGYQLHPALLDACFHVAGVALPDALVEPDHVFVPLGAARCVVHEPGRAEVWCHVEVAPSGAKGAAASFLCSVRLTNEDGRILAEIEGLEIKQVSAESLAPKTHDPTDDWLYEVAWESVSTVATESNDSSPERWIIFADSNGVGKALAEHLEEAGGACILLDVEHAHTAASPEAVDLEVRTLIEQKMEEVAGTSGTIGVAYLWALDPKAANANEAEAAYTHTRRLLATVQALAASDHPARLWIVTQGAYQLEGDVLPPSASQAALWGLGRTAAQEQPALQCRLIDVDPLSGTEVVDELLVSLKTPGDDTQTALRDGERYAARLVHSTVTEELRAWPWSDEKPFALNIESRGSLDHLTLTAGERRAPGPGEVLVRVHATGLNFRDVLNALGMYPGEAGPLGLEGAGTVVEVGEGVTNVRAGDAVVVIGGGVFSTYVTTQADLVAPMPTNLSFEEAATIPIAFLTAYYGLFHLAGLKRGEQVLIHAAAGGVGMAAVQLAKQAGAEVFGTAGSLRKRTYLRQLGVDHVMHSRTLDFADEVMVTTAGEGVDVVLNALTGDAIPKSLSTLADGGRFLEIGKREIWTDEQVAEVREGVAYTFYDLADLALNDPAQIQEMLLHLMEQFRTGALHPLPLRTFPMYEADDAFKYMARALHIGKVVVVHPQSGGTEALRLRPDATYLVTGGLGGLGLATARALADAGARHFSLLSRRAEADVDAATADALAGLRAAVGPEGRVAFLAADVARRDELEAALAEVDRSMPPLGGVIHAAGVLDDGLLGGQTWERFEGVLAPKVAGTWNLHQVSQDLHLDFFVSFSSGSAVLGSPGQSSYAAANAFMDGLAARRRSEGRPSLSIAWGPWAEVGMAASLDAQQRARLTSGGVAFIQPEQGTDMLATLVRSGRSAPAAVAVLPIEWDNVGCNLSSRETSSLLKAELEARKAATPTPPGDDWLTDLQTLTFAEQREEVEAMLCRYVADVLRLNPGTMDTTEPLAQLGLDSLMSVELRNAVGRQIGQTLPATVVFEYPTVEALTDYLLEEVLELGTDDQMGDPPGGDRDLAPSPLDELSDQEIAALLDKKLDSLSFRE